VLNILTYRGLIEFVVQDGWPLCDFQEDIYGPKSHWSLEEDVQAFESGGSHVHVMSLIGLVASVGYSLERVWFHLSLDMDGIVVTHMEIIG
jgi:hypothetical protein